MKLSLLPISVNSTANAFEMNQLCKVCGEPAAGFHFGAFTCEGCKSFFGRTYNNLSSLNECKNNGRCVINKKNRTSCKACRLRKCLMVGMSKSGSRYGRRSNWFKIHCLMQEQAQALESSALHGNQLGSTAGIPGSAFSGASGNLISGLQDAVTPPGTEPFIDRARALGSPGAKLTSSSSPCSDSSYRMPSSPGAASDSADYKSTAVLTGGIAFGANSLTPPSVPMSHHHMFYDKPTPTLFSPLAAAAAAAAVASNRPLVAPFPPLTTPFSTPTSAYAALFPAIYQQPSHKLLLPSAYLPPHLLELYQHHHQQQQQHHQQQNLSKRDSEGSVSAALAAASVGDSESRRHLLSIVSAGMDNSHCSPCPSSPASIPSSPPAINSETDQPMDLSRGSSTGSRSAASPNDHHTSNQQVMPPGSASPVSVSVTGASSDSSLTLRPRVPSSVLSVVTETPLDLTAKT